MNSMRKSLLPVAVCIMTACWSLRADESPGTDESIGGEIDGQLEMPLTIQKVAELLRVSSEELSLEQLQVCLDYLEQEIDAGRTPDTGAGDGPQELRDDVMIAIGDWHFRNKQYDQAIAKYHEVKRLCSEQRRLFFVETPLVLSGHYHPDDPLQRQEGAFSRYSRRYPNSSVDSARLRMAQCRIAEGRGDLAVIELESFIKEIDALGGWSEDGLPTESAGLRSGLLCRNRPDRVALHVLALLLIKKGAIDKGVSLLQEYVDRFPRTSARVREQIELIRNGEVEEVRKELEKVRMCPAGETWYLQDTAHVLRYNTSGWKSPRFGSYDTAALYIADADLLSQLEDFQTCTAWPESGERRPPEWWKSMMGDIRFVCEYPFLREAGAIVPEVRGDIQELNFETQEARIRWLKEKAAEFKRGLPYKR